MISAFISRYSFLFFSSFSFFFICSCHLPQRVDTLVINGKIYTVDSAFRTVQAMAIKNGKIIATGTTLDIQTLYKADSIVDAKGNAVYPGFIDAHAHFVGYGRSLFEVNLYDCKDWDEAVARVAEFAKNHPNELWIRGRGWDQNKFPGGTYPDNKTLNILFPTTPVLLQRVDGHAAIANEKALEMAAVTATTKLTGGEVAIAAGKPTGLLIDNAVDLVSSIIPKAQLPDYEKWLTAAQKNCFAQGLTTITDCGLPYYDVAMVDNLQQSGRLQMRLYVMLSDDATTYKQYMRVRAAALAGNNPAVAKRYVGNGPYKTDRLFVKGIKAYADGALGSRGACLLQHYADKPGWGGFLLSSPLHYDSLAAQLIGTDFQLCTHAIGDSGNRMVLNVYKKYLNGNNDKRWRIEHAQVVDPADFNAFGESSIIPSVQPTHATSDMHWAIHRLGAERIKGAYAYKQLLAQNGWLPLGTDFPVEDISPFKTFYAAVARTNANGYPKGGFQRENALTRRQALQGMTIWAARAGFMEQEVGSIEVGKKADFVILDRDLMMIPINELLGVNVLSTWVGGKKVN
jgi:predicted amidohydrolase YtcJ